MVMKAKVVFLEFQKEGKNFFPVEPDGFLNKCVECGFCDRYKLERNISLYAFCRKTDDETTQRQDH